MENRYIGYSQKPGLLRRTVAVAAFAVTAAFALMFSALFLAMLLFLGAIAGIYLWWKMRGLRRQMREFSMQNVETFEAHEEGVVIEGEAVRVDAKRYAS